jgi:RB1-inducible coiled-coil protein 1
MLAGLEVDRLKQLLIAMSRISRESVALLKQQILDLKACAMNESQMMKTQIDQIVKAYDDLKTETHNHERELIQRLTVDHELEMNDLSKKLYSKDDEIFTLKSEKEKCELEKSELQQRVEELEKKFLQQTHEKEAALKALKDDHRNEIESLRCKFKLMTSSKTSPSESSLDRIDTIDISQHQTIIDDLKSKFEEDMEKAVKEAIEKTRLSESSKWSLTASMPHANSPGKSPKDNQDILKRLLDERTRQLDEMREHVEMLKKESDRLKSVIQSITDESEVTEYKDKLEELMHEKTKIERELEKEKTKRAKSSNQNVGGVTINSCSKNDIVLVVWNHIHEQYIIVQDSSILYFLHAESYVDLKLSSNNPRACFSIGRVTDKEYCHAKKDENRYKVGKGTKFYRVKVRARSPSNRGEMERSATERKKIKRSTGEQKIFMNFLLFLPDYFHLIFTTKKRFTK